MDTSKFFAAVATMALYIGVLFDVGYFWLFNMNFFMLLSYRDHLAVLALFAVPCLFLALLFIGLRRRSKNFDVVMCCWIALVFFVFAFTGKLIAPILPQAVTNFAFWFKGLSYFFLIPYLTAVILDSFFAFMDSEQPRAATGPEAGAFLGLIVLILMFGNFYYSAQVAVRQFETEVTFAPNGKIESRPQPAHIVRAIDNGFFMILRDAPDRVVFVKKDAVIMLSMKAQK